MTIFQAGLLASILAGLATGLGALPALFLKKIDDKILNTLLGGAVGVMLAATSFSLIVPGIERGTDLCGSWGVAVVAGGILLGAIVLDRVDKMIPHEHFVLGREGPSSKMKRIWLFIIAITIHNFPEGLAVGVAFGTGDFDEGTSLAIGIGLQNMPEGLTVAFPLIALGYNKWKAVGIALATGLVEPVGGLLGAGAVTLSLRYSPSA